MKALLSGGTIIHVSRSLTKSAKVYFHPLLNPSIGVSLLTMASGVRLGTLAEPPVDDSQFMIVSTATISPPRAELRGQKVSISTLYSSALQPGIGYGTCECVCLGDFETAIP